MVKTHVCQYCGKTFEHRVGIKRVFNKYCSRLCSGLSSATHFKKQNSPHWKNGMPRTKKCLYCGIEIRNVSKKDIFEERKNNPMIIFTYQSISMFQKQKFCSKKCSQLGKPYQKKENHWNWRGGKSELRSLVGITPKYKKWRKEVFKRDNYTCQICKKRGGNIEADHRKPFSIIVKEHNIKTVEEALVCDELWKLSNGRTLCISCHRKTFVFLGNQFTVNITNGVNSGKPRTGNPEPSQEIANRLLEGVETRLNKYNATNAPPKGKR